MISRVYRRLRELPRRQLSQKPLLRRVCVAVATGFYLSYIPLKLQDFFLHKQTLPSAEGEEKGSLDSKGHTTRWTGCGFVGTLVGWAEVYFLPSNAKSYIAAAIIGILIAVWTSTIAERELGNRDDSRIVIDEVVGYWVTVMFLPQSFNLYLAGFILFRFFDAVKLPPYRWLEDLPAGWGVVMDDVGAGVVANICLRALGHWTLW